MDKSASLSTSQLNLSADKKKLLLTLFNYQINTTEQDITNLLERSEHSRLKIITKGLEEISKRLDNARRGIAKNLITKPIIIAEYQDAKLSISFDPLKVTAKAQITSAYGGNQITSEELIAQAQAQNIKVGINEAAINLLVSKSNQSPPGTAYQITIATGEQPINGHNAHFTALLKPHKEQLIESIKEEHEQVDMSNIEEIITVEPGTELIKKTPYLAGQDGLTVTGKVLSHTSGHDVDFFIGENTKISESNPNMLISTVHGTVVPLPTGVKVQPSLVLDSLNKGTLPIQHDGTLIIKGDVPPGTNIAATGDITVIGFIESSEVKCGGDLIVTKGIIGEAGEESENKFRSKIECQGTLYASFIQHSTIISKQDVNVKHQLIHSNVFSEGYIRVEDNEQQKGAIFGGYLAAKKGIETITLGVSSGVKTTLDLNGFYMKLINIDKDLRTRLEETKDNIQEVLKAQVKLNELKKSDKTIKLKRRLVSTISELKGQLVTQQNQIKENENKIQQCLQKTKVHALKATHSNVSIGIGKKVFTSEKKYGATTFHIRNGELVAESYQK